jgi:hypothetical protein
MPSKLFVGEGEHVVQHQYTQTVGVWLLEWQRASLTIFFIFFIDDWSKNPGTVSKKMNVVVVVHHRLVFRNIHTPETHFI